MTGFRVDMSPLVNSSINMGNAYRGIGQSLGGALQSAGNAYARSQQQEQQQQAQMALNDLKGRAMNGDPEALQQLMTQSPPDAQEVAQFIQQQSANTQEQNQYNQRNTAFEQSQTVFGQEQADRKAAEMDAITLKANQKTIKNIYAIQNLSTPEERDSAFKKLIDDPNDVFDVDDMKSLLDPKNLQAEAAFYFGKDAEAMFGGFGGGDGPLPAEAIAFNDLIKDMTPAQKKTAKQIKAGLKGRAVTNAELTAIEDGSIKSYSDYKVQQKQAEKFAEATGASRARIIDKGFESINKANTSLRNIDKAIAVLDQGAGVGAIEKLWPSITAASVELDNIRNQMALDVVGATTFGALSQGELDLAKDVALPTGLDTAELKDYLIRKKAAQIKLRDYYNEQIQHLDQGGTIASFLRSKNREAEGGSSEVPAQQQQAPQAALQMLQQNPAMAEQFKAKYGYLPEGM